MADLTKLNPKHVITILVVILVALVGALIITVNKVQTTDKYLKQICTYYCLKRCNLKTVYCYSVIKAELLPGSIGDLPVPTLQCTFPTKNGEVFDVAFSVIPDK